MAQEYNANSDMPAPGGESPARRKKKKRVSPGRVILKVIGWIFLTLFTLCVIGLITAGIFFKIFMTYVDTTLVPSLGEISYEEMTMSLASNMYATDENGREIPILSLYDNSSTAGGNRELIEYSDLPDHLVKALVAIEDKRFWTHHGVDWWGTGRAIYETLLGGNTQGGSTITQQLLRNLTQDNEVTVKRKFREIFRALEFEKTTSKEDIITMYLNLVFFGQSYYGIQTAAKGYFGKDVSELDLAESAAIIGITNNPSLYDPFRDAKFKQDDGTYKTPRDFNKSRQEIILKEMLDQGLISEAEYAAAKAEKLLFTDTPEYAALHGLEPDEPDEEEDGESASGGDFNTWFEDQAINEAIDLIAEARGVSRETASTLLYNAGYHIYTTVDLGIQEIVDSVYQDPSNFDYPSAKGTPLASAITIIDPYTGDVKAVAGGVGQKTENRSLSLATARRPPGSAIKPVSVYAPAIEYDVVTPGSIIDDYPIRLNDSGTGGFPKNSPVGYRGNVTVATGVKNSINTVASRTLEKLTYARSFEFMENNLGFDLDPRDIALSPLAMGGLTYGVTTVEMAAAYGAFVNEGIYTKPRTILRIESNDHTEVIVDNTVPQSWPAMKETTAYLVTKMLRSVVSSGGTGTAAVFDGMPIAGKTGTTNNNFDRYFVGITPYYSAAVWVGYRDGGEKIVAKGNPAVTIWKKVMEKVHEGLESRSFPDKPSGISSVQVCADCGLKPGPLCSSDYRGSRVISVEMQSSAIPSETCTCHVEVQVCTDPDTGEVRLASEFCPEETVSTRVMLAGREHLGIPDGSGEEGSYRSLILADDSMAHLTYFSTLGVCPIHDENYVPDPGLPEGGEPLPGDPDYQWPTAPWNPDDVLPGGDDPGQPAEPPDASGQPGGDPSGGGDGDPSVDPSGGQEPADPEEPALPEEPVLP